MFQLSGGAIRVRALVETNSVTTAPGSQWNPSRRCLRLGSFDPQAA
jgi:hypothetical protein